MPEDAEEPLASEARLTVAEMALLRHHVDEGVVLLGGVEEVGTCGRLLELVEPSALEEGGVGQDHLGVDEVLRLYQGGNAALGGVRDEVVDGLGGLLGLREREERVTGARALQKGSLCLSKVMEGRCSAESV